MSVVEVEILNGLPGSGKSFYADNEYLSLNLGKDHNGSDLKVVHLDEEDHFHSPWFSIFTERLILDGLILTNKDIIDIIKRTKEESRCSQKLHFTVIHWNEDREACLHNDTNRRDVSSKKTIKCAKFEYPDVESIKKATGYTVDIKEKEVVRKPLALKDVDDNSSLLSFIHGSYLISKPWVISGTGRSYDSQWHNSYTAIQGEEQPEFDELIELLSKCCPTLSFADGVQILKNLVTVRNYYEEDYYLNTYNGEYVCNLIDLFKFLTEKGYC